MKFFIAQLHTVQASLQYITLFAGPFKGLTILFKFMTPYLKQPVKVIDKEIVITWLKNFVFGQVLFSTACLCPCVCESVPRLS